MCCILADFTLGVRLSVVVSVLWPRAVSADWCLACLALAPLCTIERSSLGVCLSACLLTCWFVCLF